MFLACTSWKHTLFPSRTKELLYLRLCDLDTPDRLHDALLRMSTNQLYIGESAIVSPCPTHVGASPRDGNRGGGSGTGH